MFWKVNFRTADLLFSSWEKDKGVHCEVTLWATLEELRIKFIKLKIHSTHIIKEVLDEDNVKLPISIFPIINSNIYEIRELL